PFCVATEQNHNLLNSLNSFPIGLSGAVPSVAHKGQSLAGQRQFVVEHPAPDAGRVGLDWTLLRKSGDRRIAPFPGQTHPTSSVMGMPSAVKPLSNEPYRAVAHWA
ncbi:hypothetical protein, partial [Rhabdonatronobacter sediminivivens]|uniref:hypothetical protein n=1 Tax=Rhabdonatronobacter sediminivivens TaxID=2743469 RepID=UPI001F3C7F65